MRSLAALAFMRKPIQTVRNNILTKNYTSSLALYRGARNVVHKNRLYVMGAEQASVSSRI